MLCDHHLTTIAGNMHLSVVVLISPLISLVDGQMAEQGIRSLKLTDPNYRAVIDKFIKIILSNYNNSICDLTMFWIDHTSNILIKHQF